jgi:hypothetical protein
MRFRAAFRLYATLTSLALWAAPAWAQYQPRPIVEIPISERYIIEGSGSLWNPNPAMSITSESLGIIGSRIDFVQDLGLQQTRFRGFKIVFHPGRKHKLRFERVPIDYQQSAVLRRDIVFNGQRYSVGVPVISELDWKAYRYAYEYDFISMSRGFGGVVLGAEQTDVNATLRSPILDEYTGLRAPVPAIGGIARVYVTSGVSITGELSGIKLPENKAYDFHGHYMDLDLYGTFNFNRIIGAQVGYRTLDVDAHLNSDSGSFTLKGWYFGFVARY